jgi:hypothetical protein
MREHFERSDGSDGMFARCQHMTEKVIQENPVVATLAMFGLGFGLGTIIGSLLASSESMSPFAKRRTHSRGRQWLNAMSGALPDAIRSHLPR